MTLVELIIAGLISVIVGGIIASLLFAFIRMYTANNDVMAAAFRADTVIRVLDYPVLHAGLGLPTANEEDYYASWGNDGPLVKDWGNNWRDAIYITEDQREIGIVYAVPTGLKVESGLAPDGRLTLLKHNLPSDMVPKGPANLDSWIAAPGIVPAAPMEVIANDTNGQNTMTVKAWGSDTHTLYPNQELYRLKAFRAFVDADYNFRMVDITDQKKWKDITGSGITIEKIRAVRFSMNNRRILKVSVLAMGDATESGRTDSILPSLRERWPELGSDPNDGLYYLQEFSVDWRVRNIEERVDQ